MLFKNFIREVVLTLPRLMSVVVVTALGVLMYVGMGGISYNFKLVADNYYQNYNVADFWVYGNKLTKDDEKKLLQVKGVSQVQSRVVLEAQPVRDKDVTVVLHAVSGGFDINSPYIVAGRLPQTGREFALYDGYADKHNISVGDACELKIKETGHKITLTVCGLIRSPEYIYNISGIDLIPDSYRLGFAYMREESLQDILGKNSFNQVCVRLEENADIEAFKAGVDESLGKKVTALVAFEDNPKASILADALKEMRAVTIGLPTLFFLISSLIMFTTMTRIIEGTRMQTGTLKALGYGDLSIFAYYLSYAQVVIILGVLLGTFPSLYITNALMEIYKSMMSMPDFTTRYSMASVVQAIVITNVFCTGTSFYICLRELREMPAECIRPKKPKTGNKNIIERIGFVWRKMTFTEKTVARNIFRNKMRLTMCVAGVVGCMAIIITAFGISDSNDRFFSMLFDKLHRYDLQVLLKADATEAQYKRIQSTDGVEVCEYQMVLTAAFKHDGKKETSSITVSEDEISLMLLDINSGFVMKMPGKGAVVSSVLARKLNIQAGDMLEAEISGTNRKIHVEAVQILKNINGIYVGRSAWRALGQEYRPTAVYISASAPERAKDKISDYEFVLAVKQKGEIVASIESQLGTVKVMVFILTVFGGVLAFVVLYNLGIMNYFERTRELATLMVLGFYDKEIKVLVLRENTIFTIAGIILGIPFGIWFHSFLMGNSESAGFEVDIYVSYLTFFIAAGLTFMFSMFVNLTLGKRFREIDMVGALKSVE